MLKTISEKQIEIVRRKFDALMHSNPLPFKEMTPSKVPSEPGVYIITAIRNEKEEAYYVGRTKNLRQRLYNNHLMGPLTNARLKKHMIDAGECIDKADAKQFIRNYCLVRWFIEASGFRERGALEGYATALLFPKHGIYEEH